MGCQVTYQRGNRGPLPANRRDQRPWLSCLSWSFGVQIQTVVRLKFVRESGCARHEPFSGNIPSGDEWPLQNGDQLSE